MEKLYTASVTATGGRNGQVTSSDGLLDLKLRKPEAMGGTGGATNPEQLFAAAWGPCYLGALGAVAQHDEIDVSQATVNVLVSFNKDGNAFALSADLEVHIPGIEKTEAQKLAEKAHRACPYSKATKGNIKTSITAV